ncbi:outer membrane protein assembly factor [Herbaspirillum sp. HC18]|nr:outer membrane protein assembly factor [Herbaspirillum sp. HC18]
MMRTILWLLRFVAHYEDITLSNACYRLRCLLAVCLTLLFSVPLFASAQETHSFTVEIHGAENFSDLLKKHVDISRESDSELPAEQIERLFGAAPQQIRDLLATEGRFSPSVRPALDKTGPRWTARFDIDPGPAAHIASVTIRFKGEVAAGPHADERRMERLRRRWKLDESDVFRQADWSEAKSDLLKDFLTRDYPAAAIAFSEARIDPGNNTAVLTVEVDSGPAFTFGNLEIHGLERYSRTLIDIYNPIKPGDAYSQEKLNELQSRLEDTGYFRSAFATVDVDPAHAKEAPVRLDLTENPRKRLSLGVGFSTDTGARVQAKWLDRLLFGHDLRLESQLRIDSKEKLLGGDIYLPPATSGFLPHGWVPSFGAHLEETTTNGENNDKIRAGARITSPNRVDEKVWAINYYGDHQRIGNTFLNNRQALMASFTYTRRRLDQPLQPRRGYIASVELGAGPPGLINEKTIARVLARGLLLRPLAPRWQAALRAQIGQVFGGGRETVPADLLFLAGGDQSVRGYAYNALGVEQDGAIVAAPVTAVVSGELVYQVTPQWGAAVFVDSGNAADSWSSFSMKTGAGVGARWRSPIGPVNIDLAYGLAVNKVRLHFSVGYGF